MNISEAAKRSGVTAKMIRHYEAIGLISSDRKANNFRTYTDKTISILRFIRHARELNLPSPR
ncbi:MerR family DNA-binding transcriptional regulator [Sabulicella glaciei]|uniref:MerR family DNA-binding transcriptional regulator n=1 Tax=Sabulicella glaciei TaxID=2984948 RepID=A0ABT3P3Z9_9PROT|nr:MerR family DNA-binding transcriptional regulator [Roseococcus sp. MDT2-1-1]MCW8088494.1 MerR family DNA-binding transcriptional regulator [Roseococcus sp. MDT2-1-1]